MPSVGHFLSILEAVSRRDWKSLREIGLEVAEEERKKKHFGAAHRIIEAIEVASSNSGYDLNGEIASASAVLKTTPPELLHQEDITKVTKPTLSGSLQSSVDELLKEWRAVDKLKASNLKPRQSLLLYGPPGCGKTHLAKYIAKSLSMRLFVVRFDALISSLLGETGSNIKTIFEFAALNKCVLFIDEIDAIAKLRDDKNELGELKRVVISLLQNLDFSHTDSLLIAATNHPHMLDPALWRRFQAVWELNLPAENSRKEILENYLSHSIDNGLMSFAIDISNALTGADLSSVATLARTKSLINEGSSFEESLLLAFIEHFKRSDGLNNSEKAHKDALLKIALRIRDTFGKKYSYKDLENLTGVPHSTIHNKSSADAKGV